MITLIRINTQGGYSYDLEVTDCANCPTKIERPAPRSGGAVKVPWMHANTSRTVCLLPADTSKTATPR